MKKTKLLFAIILSLAMLFTGTALAFTFEVYEDVQELFDEPTQDSPSGWAAGYIDRSNSLNMLPPHLDIGYTQTLTLAEYCALAVSMY